MAPSDPNVTAWPMLPYGMGLLGATAVVPGVRALAREPFLRRPWAYPIAAIAGFAAGRFIQRMEKWEAAETIRIDAALAEKRMKLRNADVGREGALTRYRWW